MIIVVLAYQLLWAVIEGIAVHRFRARRFEAIAVSSENENFLPQVIGGLAIVFAVTVTINSVLILPETVSIEQILGGVIFGVIGLVLRFASIRELGPSFRDTIDLAPNQKRITTGPYRLIRHPAEVGFFLLMVGLFALSPGWVAFCLLVVIEVLCIRRMLLENRLFAT